MWNGMLPIGSVVQLGGGITVMVAGLCQMTVSDEETPGELYDYAGVPYPIGLTRSDEMVQFNHDAVEKVLAIGFMNDEMLDYMPHIQRVMDGLRDGSITPEELMASGQEETGEDDGQ